MLLHQMLKMCFHPKTFKTVKNKSLSLVNKIEVGNIHIYENIRLIFGYYQQDVLGT